MSLYRSNDLTSGTLPSTENHSNNGIMLLDSKSSMFSRMSTMSNRLDTLK